MNRLLNLKKNTQIEDILRPYHDALDFYKKHGLNTLRQIQHLSEMLYQNEHFEEASLFYLYAFEHQNSQKLKYPTTTNLLYLSLLSLIKAGKPLPPDELSALEELSQIHANNVLGIQTAWQENNPQKALTLIRNGFEHFPSGDQIDACYLEFSLKYFKELSAPIHPTSYSPIPHRLYSYWEGEIPDEIQKNFDLHKSFLGEAFTCFNKETAGIWLLEKYGLEVFTRFEESQTPEEASELFRIHLLLAKGGWWIAPNLHLTSEEAWIALSRLPKNARFYVDDHSMIRQSFLGATPNHPIFSNAAITCWTNIVQFQVPASHYKTGSGIFIRAINRSLYNAFMHAQPLPSLAIGTASDMFSIVEEFEVHYKSSGNWHTA